MAASFAVQPLVAQIVRPSVTTSYSGYVLPKAACAACEEVLAVDEDGGANCKSAARPCVAPSAGFRSVMVGTCHPLRALLALTAHGPGHPLRRAPLVHPPPVLSSSRGDLRPGQPRPRGGVRVPRGADAPARRGPRGGDPEAGLRLPRHAG